MFVFKIKYFLEMVQQNDCVFENPNILFLSSNKNRSTKKYVPLMPPHIALSCNFLFHLYQNE
ncbi:MAG: hypothetical protein EAZ57_08310 [Cytophagales bacterium]|nr:MAG: hypothetical protein EAZ57_08310 [Cytophagales bacterium]